MTIGPNFINAGNLKNAIMKRSFCENEHTDCLLCGYNKSFPLTIKSGYKLVVCRKCRLVYQNPRMTDQVRRANWTNCGDQSTSFLNHYNAGENWRTTLGNKRLDILSKKGYSKGRLLDVGCATGVFCRVAETRGFSTVGVDVTPDLVEFGRDQYKLDLWLGDILDFPIDNGKFDVITMFDVFSSLSNPLLSLKKLRSLLAPGGIIWITASYANIGLLLFKEANPFNSYVTPSTMRSFLSKAGFSDIQTRSIVKNANMPELHVVNKHFYKIPIINTVFKKMVEAFAKQS